MLKPFSPKIFFIVSLAFFLAACSSSRRSQVTTSPTESESGLLSPLPDYADTRFWAAHPMISDPSDTVPPPFGEFSPDTSIDVFFLHPTSYNKPSQVDETALAYPAEQLRWNASLLNEAVNEKTDKGSIFFQASAFNQYRLFAPRYRQAHIRAFFIPDTLSKPFFDTAYADILSAFQYYLTHYNQGRPFIIASHSQGTLHAARLIKEEIEKTSLKEKLVAAYLIGMPVPTKYFEECPPCSTSSQTGCIISWRTFKKGHVPDLVKNEKYKTIVTNPLTWTTQEDFAAKRLNKGSLYFDFSKPRIHSVSAQVHGNILWANKPRFKGSLFFTRKNYHIGDINLYWKNIRDNLQERVLAYRLHHQQ